MFAAPYRIMTSMTRLALGFLILVNVAGAQQYPFTKVAGSPKNIEHILEDRQGRLWIATHDDVLCFDGSRFLSLRQLGFAVKAGSLTEDDEGGILIAGDGVDRFFRGNLEHVLTGIRVSGVISVAPGLLLTTLQDPSMGRMTPARRIRRVGAAWQSDELTGWYFGLNLSRDQAGTILAQCPGGWCEASSSTIANWSPQSPIAPVLHQSTWDFSRVTRDRFHCVWFRSREAGAYQCADDPGPKVLPTSVIGRNVWVDIGQNEDGSMLFASVNSVALGRPGSFSIVTPANGLPAESVSSAIRSRDGSIWVASLSGLYRFSYPFQLSYWKSQHGLVWSFAKSGKTVYAGTSAGIARLTPSGGWDTLSGSREFGSVSSLLPASDGSLYAAVAGQAVIKLRPDGTLAGRTPPGQGGGAAALAQTPDGSIWLGGNGIYRVVEKGHDLALLPEKIPGAPLPETIVHTDPRGGLWGCFSGNLIRREAGTWRSVAHDSLLPGLCRSLAFAGGDVWAGFNTGLGWVHASATRVIPSADPNGVASWALALDARGWLWRGSSDGMHVGLPDQARDGRSLLLNEADGLPDLDVNHGSLFADPDGSIWWAAATGIMHFGPPRDLLLPDRPPPVFVSALSIEGAPFRLAETVQQFPSGRRLTAAVGSLQFKGRNAVHLRYRVLPEQKAWRESSTFDLELGKLPWGNHSLEIQSRFLTGPWSPTVSAPMIILRPWWISWPALISCIAILGVTGGAARRAALIRKRRANWKPLPDLAGWRQAVFSPASELVGTTLDRRFEILGVIARGGFATVFKGKDKRREDAPCAIKVFRNELIDAGWLAHRFQQEVASLEKVRHPAVVSIYGHGVSPTGAPYLALEFIEGCTLRDLLNSGQIPRERAASLLIQAAEALHQIHRNGIFHRDLKPENLMLRAGAPEGRELVLIDFSIAIIQSPDQTIHGLSRAAGTICYMAPEQAVGFATAATDIYSLAKVALEMFTGRRLSLLLPDAGMDLPERVREFARALPLSLSEESIDLLGSALEFDPSRRPAAVLEFAGPIVRDLTSKPVVPSASPCLFPTNTAPAARSSL